MRGGPQRERWALVAPLLRDPAQALARAERPRRPAAFARGHACALECDISRCFPSIDPNVLVGKPIIKGTRISVELIVDLLARGWTVEEILQEYDHVTRDDIQACLAYAGDVLKSERVYLLPDA